MTSINIGVGIGLDLSKTPINNATKIISAATAFRPSLAIPLMPPPASLCDGERRAQDGGVEPMQPSTKAEPRTTA